MKHLDHVELESEPLPLKIRVMIYKVALFDYIHKSIQEPNELI